MLKRWEKMLGARCCLRGAECSSGTDPVPLLRKGPQDETGGTAGASPDAQGAPVSNAFLLSQTHYFINSRKNPRVVLPHATGTASQGARRHPPGALGVSAEQAGGTSCLCLAVCREETGSQGGVGAGLGPKPTPILRTGQSWGMKSLHAESPQHLRRWSCITK